MSPTWNRSVVLEPAINVPTRDALLNDLRDVRDHVPIVQIDVIDGIFARPKTVDDPSIVRGEIAPDRLHIHLMVADVPSALIKWNALRPRRLTIHVEATSRPLEMFSELPNPPAERGLAISPATPLDAVLPYARKIDFLLFLSVPPGKSGQAFVPDTIGRIAAVHRMVPELPLGVDGGVTPDRIAALVHAGVSSISVGSGIFHARDRNAALIMYATEISRAVRMAASA